MMGAWAIDMRLTGNVKIKGAEDFQAHTSDFLGDPFNSIIARLIQDQE